jgi:polyisoprenoid-binding protein YceI
MVVSVTTSHDMFAFWPKVGAAFSRRAMMTFRSGDAMDCSGLPASRLSDFPAVRCAASATRKRRPEQLRFLNGASPSPRWATQRNGAHAIALILALSLAEPVWSAPVLYKIDAEHTFPSFEAGHMGLSIWRGRFDRTRGTIQFDQTASEGTVDVTVDTRSVDFGLDTMNEVAKSGDWLDVGRFPEAFYKGKLATFVSGTPTEIVGALTLRGVTKPLNLQINMFKCLTDTAHKQKRCGADATGRVSREDFNVNPDKRADPDVNVTLRIQVEAIAVD